MFNFYLFRINIKQFLEFLYQCFKINVVVNIKHKAMIYN